MMGNHFKAILSIIIAKKDNMNTIDHQKDVSVWTSCQHGLKSNNKLYTRIKSWQKKYYSQSNVILLYLGYNLYIRKGEITVHGSPCVMLILFNPSSNCWRNNWQQWVTKSNKLTNSKKTKSQNPKEILKLL